MSTNSSQPRWLSVLSDEDLQFVRRFILSSGSLKQLAEEYTVSYPTIRMRLDRVIEKIKLADDSKEGDSFKLLLQCFVAEGQISFPLAKQIINEHHKSLKGEK